MYPDLVTEMLELRRLRVASVCVQERVRLFVVCIRSSSSLVLPLCLPCNLGVDLSVCERSVEITTSCPAIRGMFARVD